MDWRIMIADLAGQVADCLVKYLMVLVPVVIVLAIVRFGAKGLNKEVFRKLLHGVAFCSGVVLAYAAQSWQAAAAASVLFAVVVYPILALAQRWRGYSAVFNERREGEVKKSLCLLFGVTAVVIALCWGVAGQRYLVPAVLLTWGFGDAAAGLVGRAIGKHKTGIPFADPSKTWEGSAAFAVTGAVVCCIVLAVASGLGPAAIVGRSIVAGVLGAFVELVSRGGNDTFTVPGALTLFFVALQLLG